MPTKSQQQHIDDIARTLQRLDAAGRSLSDRVSQVEPIVGDLVSAIQHVGGKVDQVESATNQLSQICQAVVNHANTGSSVSNQNIRSLNQKIKRMERDIWLMIALIFFGGGTLVYICMDLHVRIQRTTPIGQVAK